MKIKICGITTAGDAVDAIDAGADALGFNTWIGSKRFIDLDRCASWIRNLPPFVTRVAVLVNPTMDEALKIAGLPFIDRVQFHGNETPEFCRTFASSGFSFIKAISVKAGDGDGGVEDYGTRDLLLDAYVPGEFGGTGMLINLEKAEETIRFNPGCRVILSGGLTPQNVKAAIRTVRPVAVDVASGVEASPGRKDVKKMREFINAARDAD